MADVSTVYIWQAQSWRMDMACCQRDTCHWKDEPGTYTLRKGNVALSPSCYHPIFLICFKVIVQLLWTLQKTVSIMLHCQSGLLTAERKKGDSDIATRVNYDVASLLSWSKCICNLVTKITRIRVSQRLLPPFEGENLEQVQTIWSTPISPRASP